MQFLMAMFVIVMMVGAALIGLYKHFPECDAGHVAALAPQTFGGWVCVSGYDPRERK